MGWWQIGGQLVVVLPGAEVERARGDFLEAPITSSFPPFYVICKYARDIGRISKIETVDIYSIPYTESIACWSEHFLPSSSIPLTAEPCVSTASNLSFPVYLLLFYDGA